MRATEGQVVNQGLLHRLHTHRYVHTWNIHTPKMHTYTHYMHTRPNLLFSAVKGKTKEGRRGVGLYWLKTLWANENSNTQAHTKTPKHTPITVISLCRRVKAACEHLTAVLFIRGYHEGISSERNPSCLSVPLSLCEHRGHLTTHSHTHTHTHAVTEVIRVV